MPISLKGELYEVTDKHLHFYTVDLAGQAVLKDIYGKDALPAFKVAIGTKKITLEPVLGTTYTVAVTPSTWKGTKYLRLHDLG